MLFKYGANAKQNTYIKSLLSNATEAVNHPKIKIRYL